MNNRQHCFRRFAADDHDFADNPRTERAIEFNNVIVKSVIEYDIKLSIQELGPHGQLHKANYTK